MPLRKSPAQVACMRRAGRVVAVLHAVCVRAARPGATTADLDAVAREVLALRGARASFLGYHGFPAVICASVNEVVAHGIPGPRILQAGDLVSIDCGAIIDGWHADAAVTIPVGEIDDRSWQLLDATRRSLDAGIDSARAGGRLGDVGAAVEAVVRAAGLHVVKDYVGHGIGTAMHEPPEVANFGPAGRGKRLSAGMALAIEPMVTSGRPLTDVLDDDWTVVTRDGSRAAHFEHTIVVTDGEAEVLTLPW